MHAPVSRALSTFGMDYRWWHTSKTRCFSWKWHNGVLQIGGKAMNWGLEEYTPPLLETADGHRIFWVEGGWVQLAAVICLWLSTVWWTPCWWSRSLESKLEFMRCFELLLYSGTSFMELWLSSLSLSRDGVRSLLSMVSGGLGLLLTIVNAFSKMPAAYYCPALHINKPHLYSTDRQPAQSFRSA